MPSIAAVFDGWGITRTDNERIRCGAHIEKATNAGLPYGQVEVVVSNNAVDRYNESIDVDGIDLKQFKRNPVILWGHDYESLPIGKAVRVWKQNGNLMMKIELAVKEYDFAKQVYDLVLAGVINAVSLGGMVTKWSDDMSSIKNMELYETSFVPIGAHRDALVVSKSLDDEKIKTIRKSYKLFVDQSKKSKQEEKHEVCEKHVEFATVSADMGALLTKKFDESQQDELTKQYNHLASHYSDFGKVPPAMKQIDSTEDIRHHINALKSLVLALEDAYKEPSAVSSAQEEPTVRRVKRLVVVRQAAKMCDKQAEMVISAVNNKLKQTNG